MSEKLAVAFLPRPLAGSVEGKEVRIIGYLEDEEEGQWMVIDDQGRPLWRGAVRFQIPLQEAL